MEGHRLTICKVSRGFADDRTGSGWMLLGMGIEGPLTVKRLIAAMHANHFAVVWFAFYPNTTDWDGA